MAFTQRDRDHSEGRNTSNTAKARMVDDDVCDTEKNKFIKRISVLCQNNVLCKYIVVRELWSISVRKHEFQRVGSQTRVAQHSVRGGWRYTSAVG